MISCLLKWGIRCIMLLLFQQNEISELFSKVQKTTEEISWVMFCYEKPWGEMVRKQPFVRGKEGEVGHERCGQNGIGMYHWIFEDLFPPIEDIQSGNKKKCQFPHGDVGMTGVPWTEETKIQGINEDKSPLLREGMKQCLRGWWAWETVAAVDLKAGIWQHGIHIHLINL